MGESWREIHSQKDHIDAMVCSNDEIIDGENTNTNGAYLVTDMVSKVIHGASCV